MSNKRSRPRYDVVVPIRFRDADDFLVQYSENISSGGVFIRTQFPPEEGTELRLSLEVPGARTALPVTGVVAYVVTAEMAAEQGRSAGCGVRFHEMDPATTRVLETFVERLQKRTRGNLLIIDDDPQVLEVLATVLRTAHFNVETVMSAIKARKLLEYSNFDLILCDLKMSRMDGFEFRDSLRQEERLEQIPFILMSAVVSDDDRKVAQSLGVLAFLEKPIDHKQLVQRVVDAIITTGATSDAPEPEKTSKSRARVRQFAEIAYKKMGSLGFVCQFTADESAVEGKVKFESSIRNVVTDQRIEEAEVRSVGHDRVQFTAPRHLANLAPIPILDLADGNAFERAVDAAYSQRLRWVELGRQVLLRFGIADELSDAGFCALGKVKIGTDVAVVSVRDPKTLAVEAVNGRPVPDSVSSDCIVDIAGATSSLDVELSVERVVSFLREVIAKEQAKAVPAPIEVPALSALELAPEPEPMEELPELDLSDLASEEPPPGGVEPPPAPMGLGAPPPPPSVKPAQVFDVEEEVSLEDIAEDVNDLFGSMDELLLTDEVPAESEDGILALVDEDDLDLL